MVENDLAHTFDVSDLDDARDTAPVLKVALDSISVASSAGNSADGQASHGAAEVTLTIAEPEPARGGSLTVEIVRSGRPLRVTLPIGDDESDESIPARVAAELNRMKDEILW